MIKFLFIIFLLLPCLAFSQDEEEVIVPETKFNLPKPQIPEKTKTKIELDLYDPTVLKVLIEKLEKSPLSDLPDQEVSQLVKENLLKLPLGDQLSESDRFVKTMTKIIKDKNALKGLINILLKREEMKNYFYIWLALMVMGFFLKKLLISKTWPGLIQWLASTYLNLTITVISFALFVTHFETEIKPILKIIMSEIMA